MKQYMRPQAVCVKLHDMMQVTVISGVADEDSLAPRLDTEENFWDSQLYDEENFWGN